MNKVLVLGLLAAACSAQAVELYNNGAVTNGTAAGNPISILPSTSTTLGLASAAASGFRLADNFTVTGAGWNVASFDVFAYQTSAVGFTFTTVAWSIVSGPDVNTGAVVGSGTIAVTNAGLAGYRVTSTTTTNTTRAIYKINADIPDLALAAGGYWLTWALSGTAASGPFVPPVPSAASGNAMQTSGAGLPFATVSDASTFVTFEVPFDINGTVIAVPEPATNALMLVGLAAVWGGARRRRRRPV